MHHEAGGENLAITVSELHSDSDYYFFHPWRTADIGVVYCQTEMRAAIFCFVHCGQIGPLSVVEKRCKWLVGNGDLAYERRKRTAEPEPPRELCTAQGVCGT